MLSESRNTPQTNLIDTEWFPVEINTRVHNYYWCINEPEGDGYVALRLKTCAYHHACISASIDACCAPCVYRVLLSYSGIAFAATRPRVIDSAAALAGGTSARTTRLPRDAPGGSRCARRSRDGRPSVHISHCEVAR